MSIKFCILFCLLFFLCSSLLANSWNASLKIYNGAGLCDTLYFGTNPNGADSIVTSLGEVNLPPVPPTSVFDCRFLIGTVESSKLYLQDTISVVKTYIFQWQAGAGGYPITIKWSKNQLGKGKFQISDAFNGMFVPTTDMRSDTVLIIPSQLSYITQLIIKVTPSTSSSIGPILQKIPAQQIYTGQKFPVIYLDNYVTDLGTPVNELTWNVTTNKPLNAIVYKDSHIEVYYPVGWIGSQMVNIYVTDPLGNRDSNSVQFSILQDGEVQWDIPIIVTDNNNNSDTVYFGIAPNATDTIDSQLGEKNLPPLPPVGSF